MTKMNSITKGESLPFRFDLGGESVSGWTCAIEVKQYPDDTATISRVVSPDGNKWVGFLTATETASLTVLGTWMVLGVLTNATDDKADVQTVRFHLVEAV